LQSEARALQDTEVNARNAHLGISHMNDTDFSQGIKGVPKGVNVRPNSRNKGQSCSVTPSEHEEESDSNTRNNFSAPPVNFNNSAKHHTKGKGKS